MKKIAVLFFWAMTGAAIAQDAAQLSEGMNFGKTISPLSKGQLVNPSAVDPNAWSGSTSMPASTPSRLGSFSTPLTSADTFTRANSLGLAGIGNSAIAKCQNYVPTGDPALDQECAAVNFLATRCITPTEAQQKILGSQAVNKGQPVNCDNTFGTGQQNFDFSNQITAKDSIFDAITKVAQNPGKTTGEQCTTQSVITEPAITEKTDCTKAQSNKEEACSQYINLTVTTTQTAAISTNYCPEGTLVGAFCQKSTTGDASPIYSCPAGQSLSGTSCIQTTTASATPNYSCPVGQTLSGSNCISVNNVSTPATVASYSCAAGYILSGSTCSMTTTTAAAVASYSCPAGQTLQGGTCVATSTSTSSASETITCPDGYSYNGSACTSSSSYAGTPNYECSSGTLSGSTCTNTATSAATTEYRCPQNIKFGIYTVNFESSGSICYVEGYGGFIYPACNGATAAGWTLSRLFNIGGSAWRCEIYAATNYTCPAGQTLSGSSCISNTTTSATISGYNCPSGGAISGSTCTITTSSSATVTYSCPVGQSLSGSNCTQTVTTTSAATPNYSCPAGQTLSGTSCIQTTTVSATPNYSCPVGQTLSGSNCISVNNVSTPATVATYSCAADYNLSGSTCTKTTISSAAVNYSCPVGSTLSGTSCITVVTSPANINYSCLDGSAAINGVCFYRSTKTDWISTCGSLEAAWGNLLGTP